MKQTRVSSLLLAGNTLCLFHRYFTVEVNDNKNKKIEEKTEIDESAPSPTPTPNAAFDMEMMLMMGGDPSLFAGMGMMGGQPKEEVVEEDTSVANATGFKIRFQASNENAIRFLYKVANTSNAYVIDDLAVNAMDDGRVDVIVTIVVVDWIFDL